MPCPERLPSCKGLDDGKQSFPNQTWSNRYIECYKNRTVAVSHCPRGFIFHHKELRCVQKVHGGTYFALFSLLIGFNW